MTATRLYFIHCLSPLHCGTGHSVDAIDLPIARERATGVPIVPGSSLKGALRARAVGKEWQTAAFGPDTRHASEHAGAVQFADARICLFPVRSVAGTFAWASSPFLLDRLARDARLAGVRDIPAVPSPKTPEDCMVPAGTSLKVTLSGEPKVVFEDCGFRLKEDVDAGKWADWLGQYIFEDKSWRDSLKSRFVVINDEAMSALLESATEVAARVRLDEEKKTVARGALWWEEALPSESILYGMFTASGSDSDKHAQNVCETATGLLQIGGKATVGRGQCLMRVCAGVAA